MAHRYGRCRRGHRLRSTVPHGHWKTTIFIAGLRRAGIVAPMVLDGPINGRSFQTYVERVLVPDLLPGDIVVMDNLGSHKETGRAKGNRSRWSQSAVFPALQPGLQPN